MSHDHDFRATTFPTLLSRPDRHTRPRRPPRDQLPPFPRLVDRIDTLVPGATERPTAAAIFRVTPGDVEAVRQRRPAFRSTGASLFRHIGIGRLRTPGVPDRAGLTRRALAGETDRGTEKERENQGETQHNDREGWLSCRSFESSTICKC